MNYKFNGYVNDPHGYGSGGYRVEFVDVIAPNLTDAKLLIKKYVKKNYPKKYYHDFEGKIERTKKVPDRRKIGVY